MLHFISLILFISWTSAVPTGRVVNGTDADEGEYPFVASLRFYNSHLCGCSIINKNWLLTAAHCVDGFTMSDLTLEYGVTKIYSNGPNIVNIVEIVKHEGFNQSKSTIDDIAVIRVETPIEFTDLIQPVKLPEIKQEFEHGTSATLIGWGLNGTAGKFMNHLQKVVLQIFSDEECYRLHDEEIFNSNICSGVPEGGKGQCGGDSGGPLLVNNHIVGIVSWSVKPCTVAPYPGVYTKVSHFVDWINDKTGGSP